MDIMKYRIITDDGIEILRSETYAGCERYWNACGGVYVDENGEHHIFIEEICIKSMPCCGCPKMETCTMKKVDC